MYQPVFNPHFAPPRKSSCNCCTVILLTFFTAMAFIGAWTIFSSASIPNYLVVDLLEQPKIEASFRDFIKKYGKDYGTQKEFAFRYNVFKKNYKLIEEFNANPDKTCTLEVNLFADLTDEEFSKYYLAKSIVPPKQSENSRGVDPNPNITKNWTSKTTPVKDQGMCGSCWTFSSVSVVETIIAIKDDTSVVSYAEQELVDCCNKHNDTNYSRSDGCNGGEEEDALDYIVEYGIRYTKDYPYRAKNNNCSKLETARVKITNHTLLKNNEEMEEYIQNQTMSVALAAGPVAFKFYKKGVVTEGCPGENLSHAVTIVGAGTENNIAYWLVRNSWGPNWGDDGYIKIMRSNKGNGMCGINSFPRIVIR